MSRCGRGPSGAWAEAGRLLAEHAAAGLGACGCCDPGCAEHEGWSECGKRATTTLWRIDMEDWTGTDMCSECAQDAMEAGVFTTEDPALQEDDEPDTSCHCGHDDCGAC